MRSLLLVLGVIFLNFNSTLAAAPVATKTAQDQYAQRIAECEKEPPTRSRHKVIIESNCKSLGARFAAGMLKRRWETLKKDHTPNVFAKWLEDYKSSWNTSRGYACARYAFLHIGTLKHGIFMNECRGISDSMMADQLEWIIQEKSKEKTISESYKQLKLRYQTAKQNYESSVRQTLLIFPKPTSTEQPFSDLQLAFNHLRSAYFGAMADRSRSYFDHANLYERQTQIHLYLKSRLDYYNTH